MPLEWFRKACEAAPHPELAAAFARINPDETPKDRIHRFRVLTGKHLDHPETLMLKAELFIAAEDFVEAKTHLGDLAETTPTARALTIMAAIERGMGADDAVVKGWLARALSAPRGPQWVCDNCQKSHSVWSPTCDQCESIDTLSWRQPADDGVSLGSGAAMLPLIVGLISEDDPVHKPDDLPEDPPEPVVELAAVEDEPAEPEMTPAEDVTEPSRPVDYVVEDDTEKP